MRPPLPFARFAPIPVALALVALGGCEESPPAPPAKPISVRSEGQDRLHRLSDLNRAIALKRAVQDSGMPCRRVTESGYVTEHRNLSMWTAACDDGREWAIFVGPDDSVQVRPCGDMARFNLPRCVTANPAEKPVEG